MKTDAEKAMEMRKTSAADNHAYYVGLCMRAGEPVEKNLPIHVLIGLHRKRNPKMAYSYIL